MPACDAAWFDPLRHWAVLVGQRGAGHSRPAGTRRRNMVTALSADLEQLRTALGIDLWGVVGRSLGVVLACADHFSDEVAAQMLRGTFLAGFDDVSAPFNVRGAGRRLSHGVDRHGEGFPAAIDCLLVVSKVSQFDAAV